MKIAILTNGAIRSYAFYKNMLKDYDMLICADGGLNHAYKMDIIPQVAMGDFDSTSDQVLDYFASKGTQVVRHPSIKNQTDTEIALDYAIEQGASFVDILAGLGSRFDHSLANVHLLRRALDQKVACSIITENNQVMLMDYQIGLRGDVGDGISLLPLTEFVTGVKTSGLAYPIEDGQFQIGQPYGVSNYMTEPLAQITISEGLLLVIRYRD